MYFIRQSFLVNKNKLPKLFSIRRPAGLIDYQATKTSLLPRIKKLCLGTNLLSVRVNSLICIGKLIHHLDRWLVLDDVLPMLQQIPSREPAVIMAVVGNDRDIRHIFGDPP